MAADFEQYLDLDGVLWYARPDLENPGPRSDGSAPWECGTISIEDGVAILGDWQSEEEARGTVADARLHDEQRAEDDYERRMGRDW